MIKPVPNLTIGGKFEELVRIFGTVPGISG
jgi:hypothetical protein